MELLPIEKWAFSSHVIAGKDMISELHGRCAGQKRRQEEYQEIHEELTKSQFELQEACKEKKGRPKFLMVQNTYKMGTITSYTWVPHEWPCRWVTAAIFHNWRRSPLCISQLLFFSAAGLSFLLLESDA